MDTLDHILVMGSIHRVLKAEKILQGEDIPADTHITPREVSADCGMVVRVRGKDVERILLLLESSGIPPVEVWSLEGKTYLPRLPAGESR